MTSRRDVYDDLAEWEAQRAKCDCKYGGVFVFHEEGCAVFAA